MIRYDNMANSLVDKDYKAFWKSVHKRSNGKAVKHGAVVGGC